MIDRLLEHYSHLELNAYVLFNNPSSCYAVENLQLLSIVLLTLVVFRMLLNGLALWILKARYSSFTNQTSGGLTELYAEVSGKAGLRRTVPLRRFDDLRPLAFVSGILRPTVFLAPVLVEKLRRDELEAVLTHELMHVRRRDGLRVFGQEILAALIPALVIFFFAGQFIFSGVNSKIAVASGVAGFLLFRLLLWRLFHTLRDYACDDRTVDAGGSPFALAAALLSVWKLSVAVPRWNARLFLTGEQAFLSNGVEGRVRRLLSDAYLRRRGF